MSTIDPTILAAISHNYAMYARACDEKRYDLLTRVFAPDAVLAYQVAGSDFSCSGAQAARAFAQFLDHCYWTSHLIGSPAVEFDAAQLRASARVTATHLQRRSDGSMNRWLVRGSYHDIFERRDETWLIVRRDCVCLDADGEFETEGVERFPEIAWASREVVG